MSKWNRPMRRFAPAQLRCRECGQPVRAGDFGGWAHIRPIGIRDPQWHFPVPA